MSNEDLVIAIQEGRNVTENMAALYVQNLKMIMKIAARFAGVEEVEDLRQEAYFGLVRAVEMWKPKQDVLFMSYATYWIKQAITKYVYDHNGAIRVPVNQRERIKAYNRAVNSYRVQFARDPEPIEVMRLLDINRGQYEQLLKDIQTVSVTSSSIPIGDDGEDTLEDFFPAEDDQYEEVLDRIQHEELSREIWAQVDQLTGKNESAVIRGRFQKNQTLKECGEALGVTPERVRSIEAKAIRKLQLSKSRNRLIPYLTDSTAYSIGTRSGYQLFINSGASAQEKAMMKLERLAGPIWPRQ